MQNNKVEPAPLPNGGKGGFLAMANTRRTALQKLELEAMKKTHEVAIAKLQQKHKSESQQARTLPTAGKAKR